MKKNQNFLTLEVPLLIAFKVCTLTIQVKGHFAVGIKTAIQKLLQLLINE